MHSYYLAKHVFVCAAGSDVIALDLKSNRYVAFERAFWAPIARNIGGWPASSDEVENAAADSEAVSQLLETGLLTRDRNKGKDASPATLATPTMSLIDNFTVTVPRIRVGHVFAFVWATVLTFIRLRTQPIARVAASVRRRAERIRATEERDAAAGLNAARELTEVFRRLRPLIFTSRSHCLFESLTLLQFLSYYRLCPTCVFGVHAAPFAAHCWLQLGDAACNDPLDIVRRYTPIMVI